MKFSHFTLISERILNIWKAKKTRCDTKLTACEYKKKDIKINWRYLAFHTLLICERAKLIERAYVHYKWLLFHLHAIHSLFKRREERGEEETEKRSQCAFVFFFLIYESSSLLDLFEYFCFLFLVLSLLCFLFLIFFFIDTDFLSIHILT